jgi:hypothetical protein
VALVLPDADRIEGSLRGGPGAGDPIFAGRCLTRAGRSLTRFFGSDYNPGLRALRESAPRGAPQWTCNGPPR